MRNPKHQLVFVLLTLIILICLGVFFTIAPSHINNTEDNVSSSNEEWLSSKYTQYKSVCNYKNEDNSLPFLSYKKLFTYNDTLCFFDFLTESNEYLVVSLETGNILKTYRHASFNDNLIALNFDEKNSLYSLCYNDINKCLDLFLCENSNAIPSHSINITDFSNIFIYDFQICKNYLFIKYSTEDGEDRLAFVNLSNGSETIFTNVCDFCIDNKDNIYLLCKNENSEFYIEKYDLPSGLNIWIQNELGFNCSCIKYYSNALYLLDGLQKQWKITRINIDNGEKETSLLNTHIDLDYDNNFGGFSDLCFEIASNRICFFAMDYNMSEDEKSFCTRYYWLYEPFIPKIDENDKITLTITSPYPVESVMGSIKKYQKNHPEIEIKWDTQYLSREDYQADSLQYKEQITLRTITGDTGDIQMIVGAGISQDVITQTDAFTDLSNYLYESKIYQELNKNFLSTVTADDGTIRAIPMAITPSFYIYNETLINDSQIVIDPFSVTWSELINLAAEWEQLDLEYSLISSTPSNYERTKESILSAIILSNLYYDLENEGVSIFQEKQFVQLLEKIEQVWNSPCFVSKNGDYYTNGFFDNSLFTYLSNSTYFNDAINICISMSEKENVDICIAPKPWGEIYKKQQAYGFCWGIPNSSQNKDAAWNLLEFILSENGLPGYEYSKTTYTINNYAFEKRFNEWELLYPSKNGNNIFESLETIREIPISRYDEIYGWYDAVLIPIKNYLNGDTSLDFAIKLASNNWDRLLAR